MTKNSLRHLVSVALTLGLHEVAGAAETGAMWTVFHGSARDNRSSETGLLRQWPEGGPPLLWKATGLGKGYSSVTLAAGRIFTAGTEAGRTHVLALDMDGKELWRTDNGAAWQTRENYAAGYAGARATPTLDGDRVYHLGDTGALSCLAAATGEAVWRVDLRERFGAQIPKYGFCESILVEDQRLFCVPGGPEGALVCLDKATGETLWANRTLPGPPGYSTLQRIAVGDRQCLLGMTGTTVFVAGARDGRLLWHADYRNARINNATDPIYHDGCVYATSGYGKGSTLFRLTPTPEGIEGTPVWTSALLDNHHGGVVLLDGWLYGAGHQAKGWHCLAFDTGKPAWTAPGKGSLTYAEGRLYCLEERGTMRLVEATPEAFRCVGTFSVPPGGKGLYWAHPVVCGGRLYLRHDAVLYAYDIRAHGDP
ncbi:MAG: PQQ-like beta-propeller repeat protein [Lentisphaeria bacterium]|nr:PQQ-like beta-propeller repeat protein [Lentisphaeria bacterium]